MTCPIPNTHNRLKEIHRLWHQCLDNYFDPEGFRTNLNAAIQALRNLTFALQNEKKAIPNFDDWYSNWQTKMGDDELLKWLNKARVKIVHQKDLETKSIAKVTVKNYLDIAELKMELPPFIPIELIASQCVKSLSKKYPEHVIKNCYAVIERRWTEANLPNWELLDALAYGFNFFSQLINEAHEMANCKISTCSMRDTLHKLTKEEIETGRYVCMTTQQGIRSETITLSDFATVTVGFKEVKLNEKTAKKTLKKYKIHELPFNEIEILGYAKKVNEIAKKVLVKDKYHRQIFMLHSPSRGWKVIDAEVENQTSKFILMSQLGEIVKKDNIDAIIHVSEIWLTQDISAVAKGVSVAETKDKREALSVTVIGKNNINKTYLTIFKRGLLGKIILNKTEVNENLDGLNYLNPIKRIWDSN
ncbi:hypothetical protein [Bacillus sp. FJAT-27245]|uniref:hypothetical protein n=1 Tax=Bacillus sp. FJAT-27245 TaxID=1684144 RepID=UPI0006A78EC2|nr:hypothetical protein [Bacillus sp. FJAT-27245]